MNHSDNKKITIHSLTPFLSIIILFSVLSLFNLPILDTIWHYSFDDGTYSHAYLIPFIVLYLFYVINKQGELKYRDSLSAPALALLIISAYILFVTSTAQISLLYWFAILLLYYSTVNFVFKTNIRIMAAASYFIFLLPVWGILTNPLQTISIFAVNLIMSFTTIPVFVENEFVQIPSGVFEIADGCSGLRYLLTSLAISTLFSCLYFKTIKNTTIFISVAILGALLTNWLRITALIIIGHQTNMTSDLMADHNMFGWYLYIPFMFLLFRFGGYLTEKEKNKEITVDNSTTIPVNKPKGSFVFILITALLLSSTSLNMSGSINIEKKPINAASYLQPIIYNYSSIEFISKNPINTQLIYSFNEHHLESKPTYFENNFIPENWFVVDRIINSQNQIFTIKNGLKTAIITVSYEISGLKVGSPSKFKLERLKQAIFGKGTTKLHWQFQLN
jgi:exosortase A